MEYQFKLDISTAQAYCTITTDRDLDSDPPETVLVLNLNWPSVGTSRVKWDDRGVTFGQQYVTLSIEENTWAHIAICYNGASEVTFWYIGALLHQYTNCATLSNCDAIFFSGTYGSYSLREVAVHPGVKYTAPWTFETEGRWNAKLHAIANNLAYL